MKITARYPWATRELWDWLGRIEMAYRRVFTVTSLYRPAWYNQLVGGLWNSYHTKAKAADLAPDSTSLGPLADAALTTKPPKGQVVIEAKNGIVHLEIED